jgi:hypothetical protein
MRRHLTLTLQLTLNDTQVQADRQHTNPDGSDPYTDAIDELRTRIRDDTLIAFANYDPDIIAIGFHRTDNDD